MSVAVVLVCIVAGVLGYVFPRLAGAGMSVLLALHFLGAL